jgi:tetratricopeptide (TPR) repeat protein
LLSEARAAEKGERIDDAIKKYQAILELDPKFTPAYENLGKLDFQQSRYEEAIKNLRQALELKPQSVASRALLGICLYKVGEFQDARHELESAYHLSPNNREIEIYLARSLVETGNLEDAARQFQQLRREDPQNAEVLYAMGQLYMKLAAATFDDLQTRAPDSYLIEVLLGDLAETGGFHPEAIEHYRKAIAKKGSDARGLHYPLGHALYGDGQYEEALREFHRELELNPYDYMASYEAAEMLLKDNPQEALRLATQALEVKPDLAPALRVRGRALLLLGRPQDAVVDLKKAESLSPREPLVHFHLAHAYRQLGLNNEAQREEALYRQLQEVVHTPPPPSRDNK